MMRSCKLKDEGTILAAYPYPLAINPLRDKSILASSSSCVLVFTVGRLLRFSWFKLQSLILIVGGGLDSYCILGSDNIFYLYHGWSQSGNKEYSVLQFFHRINTVHMDSFHILLCSLKYCFAQSKLVYLFVRVELQKQLVGCSCSQISTYSSRIVTSTSSLSERSYSLFSSKSHSISVSYILILGTPKLVCCLHFGGLYCRHSVGSILGIVVVWLGILSHSPGSLNRTWVFNSEANNWSTMSEHILLQVSIVASFLPFPNFFC